jgi:hypothetical protein
MLLTQNRIRALSQINRFAGWTSRPYSVLEHSVIGAVLCAHHPWLCAHQPDVQRAFLLHDMEETVFGDIISPVKHRYMSAQYYQDVGTWNRDLATETGVPLYLIESLSVKWTDAVMMVAEWQTVYVGEDRYPEAFDWKPPVPPNSEREIERAVEMINGEFYAGDLAIKAFWHMWAGS